MSELIDRNGAVEVELVADVAGAPDAPPVTFRQKLRPFEYDAEEGVLVVEKPRPSNQLSPDCKLRTRIDIYIVTSKVRLVASHEVRAIEPYQLNERQRVTTLRLQRVGAVDSAQRRASFRVDTSALEISAVTLNLVGPGGRQLRPIKGQMVNLSSGGVGIKVSADAFAKPPKLGTEFDFFLPLGEGQETLHAPVRLRRLQDAQFNTVLLGVEFDLDHARPDHQRLAESLNRLTTNLQREQLRKRRGA